MTELFYDAFNIFKYAYLYNILLIINVNVYTLSRFKIGAN